MKRMITKKRLKDLSKRTLISFVGFATIFMMTGGPILAAAPTISSVTVTEKYISVTFDQNVVSTTDTENANWGASASNLSNYSFESPTGTSQILSRYDPYSHWTDSYVSGGTDGVLNIFGLALTASDTYKLNIKNIASLANVSDAMDGVTGVDKTETVASSFAPVISKIENITSGADCEGYPCAKIGDGNQIRITGTNFNTEVSGLQFIGLGTTQTVTNSTADAFVVTLPNDTPIGNSEVKVKNLDDKLYSNTKYFGMYNDNGGVIIGKLTNSSAGVGSDQNDIPVRIESWNTTYGSTKSHSNGYYAVVGYDSTNGYITGSVDVFFTTKAGSTQVAPTEAGGQTVAVATVTNAGTKAFVALAVVSGTITAPDETTPVKGATVVVHNDYWSTIQHAITDSNGAYKVYVPTSNTSNYYGIEARPPDYNPNGYRSNEIWTTISQGSTGTVDVSLATLNVQGTVKTPLDSVGDTNSNPSPNTIVPNANVCLHTTDWTYDQCIQTDSSGVFYFGGASAGSNYVLEVEPQYGDATFGGYSRATYSNVTIGSSGITNLNLDSSAVSGAIRLGIPNVYGCVKAGGSGVSGVWVNLNKESFWQGMNTASDGTFKFSVSQSGTYQIHVDSPNTDYSGYDGTVTISDTEVSSGKNIGNIILSTPNVTGTVKKPDGTAIPAGLNIGIDICPYMNPGQCYWGNTASNGDFGIGTVPEGIWNLQFHIHGTSVYAAPATIIITINSEGSVTNVTGGATDLDNIRLADPTVGGLLGQVVDPNGTGARGHLMLREPGMMMGGGEQWAESNDTGNFAFGTVDAGTYELEVEPDWNSTYSRAKYTITVDADGNVTSSDSGFTALDTRNIKVSLKTSNITGTVMTPATGCTEAGISVDLCDKPVQWGWINMHTVGPMMGPGGWYGTNTNESGAFSFGGVPAGTYIIEYQAGWGSAFSMVSETIIIDADVAGGDSLNLNSPPAGVVSGTAAARSGGAIRVGLPQLRGTVIDPNSNAVQNAWIMVMDTSNWNFQPKGSNTDSNGSFSIGGLQENTAYKIEVNMPWGQGLVAPSDITVTVTDGVGTISGTNVSNNTIQLSYPTNTLSGWVKKSGTTAVSNARVEAHREMGGGFVEARTDANGNYSLKLADGSWWIEVRPDWGTDIDWTYNDTPTRMTFTGNDAQTKNFSVSPTNATITGYVKKADGTAISNCWVDICQDMGMCNGRSTDSNGRFSVKVSAGTYRVSAFPPGDLMNTFGAPDEKIVTVAEAETADAGTLTLKARNSTISGRVADDAGNTVQNVVINVFQFGAPGWAMSFTDTTGSYSVSVSEGTWGVMVMPMSNQYVYTGGPLSVTVGASETNSDNDFTLNVADATIKGKVRLNSVTGNLVTDLWGGVWIKDTTANDMLDFGGPMDDMMTNSGMMDSGTGGGGPMGGGMEKGMGSGINNGAFELKVPAGTYEIGLGTPPGSSYTLSETATVTVLSDSDPLNTLGYSEVNLVVKENDATISGYFYIDADDDDTYDSGEEVSGLRAMINADRVGGGWQMTESGANGSYSINVAAGTWYVDAFIDPFMSFGASNYMVVSPDEKLTISSASNTTLNFELKELDATITGTVIDAAGTTSSGMSGVWVFADYGSAAMLTEFKGPGGPGVGAFTDANGDYSIKVSEGTYKIGVGLPPWDTRDLIAPNFLTVTVVSEETSTGNDLSFTAADATISGTIKLDGSNQSCYVRAWSDGGQGDGIASTDGAYSIKANQGSTWHLIATAVVSNVLYQSAEATVVVDAATEAQNLVLVSTGLTVPEAKTVSFDSSESKTITLTNGLILEMPAASIATSGTVTVSITPTVDVKPDAKEKPLGITYNFSARDADGKEISSLASNVTITMPYDEDLIEAAGYSEDSITPKYFNETTGTWENYDTVIRDTENNVLIIITDHFSDGGPTGQDGVPTAPTIGSAAVQSSSSITLTWTDNSSDETGFKVYRNSADSSWDSATLLTTTSENATSYPNTGLSAGTTYYYRVKATNASGDSAWSSTASATTSGGGTAGSGSALPFTALTTEPETDDEELDAADTEADGELIVFDKPISEMTIPELRAKIIEIQALIVQLQAELKTILGTAGALTTNLKYGNRGNDVELLQTWLAKDTAIYPEGLVTGWFGPLTKSAVIRFQEKYADEVLNEWGLIKGTGYVGRTTRDKLNSLYGN